MQNFNSNNFVVPQEFQKNENYMLFKFFLYFTTEKTHLTQVGCLVVILNPITIRRTWAYRWNSFRGGLSNGS